MIAAFSTRLSTGENLQTCLNRKGSSELIEIYFRSDLDTIVGQFIVCDGQKMAARQVTVERQKSDVNETCGRL